MTKFNQNYLLFIYFCDIIFLSACGAGYVEYEYDAPPSKKIQASKIQIKKEIQQEKEKKYIAVLGINQHTNAKIFQNDELGFLADLIREQLANCLPKNKTLIMTKDNINVLLPEGETIEDCQQECVIKTGQKLGADYVITGDIVYFLNKNLITLKLYEKSGALLQSKTKEIKVKEEIDKVLNLSALELFKELDFIINHVYCSLTPLAESLQATPTYPQPTPTYPQPTPTYPQPTPTYPQPTLPNINWIKIGGGSHFYMGNTQNHNESPIHLVYIKDFFISKTEITVEQYSFCVEAGVCKTPKDYTQDLDCNWGNEHRKYHPINCITWFEAHTFSQWMNGNLPSEAQWEYVAKSNGQNFIYPWGGNDSSCDYAVMARLDDFGCELRSTMQVCSKPKGNTNNGVCDMAGNVEEWVLDEYHSSYRGAPSTDQGWCSSENCQVHPSSKSIGILRGGSWRKVGNFLTTTHRSKFNRNQTSSGIGFRIVKAN